MEITDAQFEATYKPLKNHLRKLASYDGCLFETYGKELAYVQSIYKTEPGRVWTMLDADDDVVIGSGFHYVNRVGYIITEVAVPNGLDVEVID